MLNLKRAYILALTFIALTITFSQYTSQKLILKTKEDSRIVNIAGRQRMLSQKISKTAIKLLLSTDSVVFNKNRCELKNAMELWKISNRALQYGNKNLGIHSVHNSDTILLYFKQLNQPYTIIVNASTQLINNVTFNNRMDKLWQHYLDEILNNENDFLTIMNLITFQYDKESSEKMNHLSMLEYLLYGFALLLLILEAFLIFNPVLKRLKRNTLQLIENEKQLEQARVEKKFMNELKEKNKRLEQFTYITSHDLQEPLNSIISFSYLLEDSKDNLSEKGKRSVEIIKDSAYRMKEFIISILEYSRLGKEKVLKEINIEKLIANLKMDLYDLIEQKSASVEYIGKPINVMAYEPDLIKLFQNLIVNGIKYNDDITKPLVTIYAEEMTDFYKFSVSDNGIGIEKEHFDKIFEIFRRLHPRDKYSGTGIGLAYCQKVVELHGGQIWLESEIGKGTTFYFTISKNIIP